MEHLLVQLTKYLNIFLKSSSETIAALDSIFLANSGDIYPAYALNGLAFDTLTLDSKVLTIPTLEFDPL